MSEPFLAEIRIIGFDFSPSGYAFCDGRLLPISQNQSLYSLLGATYGGDGETDFALPDLRGRAPLHPGDGPGLPSVALGERGGQEQVTLSPGQMPSHSHTVEASPDVASSTDPEGNVLAKRARFAPPVYAAPANLVGLDPDTVTDAGNGQAHENRQPYQALNFVIALQGVFPPQS